MNVTDLNLDSETDPALAFSELCAAFEGECRRRTVVEAELERFTAEVAVRVESSNMLRSPDELIEMLDRILKGEG